MFLSMAVVLIPTFLGRLLVRFPKNQDESEFQLQNNSGLARRYQIPELENHCYLMPLLL